MQRHGAVTDLIHAYQDAVRDPEGRRYAASAHAIERTDGVWEAWLEFRGMGRGVTLRTGRESERADRRAIMQWAATLQPSYLDGALLRATRVRLTQLRSLLEGRAA